MISCKTNKPKILFLVSRSLSQSDGGREALIRDFINRIKIYFRVEVALFNTKGESGSDIVRYHKDLGFDSVMILNKPSLLETLFNLLRFSFFGGGTLQEAFFYSKENEKSINKILKSNCVSAIYIDMVRLFNYAVNVKNNTSVKVIFDLDDLLSLRYGRFSFESLNSAKVFGSFKSFLPSFIFKWGVDFFLPMVLKFESERCRLREKEVSTISDLILITSPAEKIIYEGLYGKGVKVCTNFPVIKPSYEISGEEVAFKELVWVGNNFVAHNYQALDYLISKLMPCLDGFTLKVAGKTPSDLLESYRCNEKVRFMGFVSELSEFFKPGCVLVAPFIFGTGVKIKILEAMSLGVAVITNDVGFQGIPFKGNVFFKPYNSDVDICNALIKLTTDSNYLKCWLDEQRVTLVEYFSSGCEEDVLLCVK